MNNVNPIELSMKYLVKISCFVGVIVNSNLAIAQFKVLDSKDPINVTDDKGMKQGKWIVFGTSRPDTCFLPTSKVEEGLYQDNRKTGIWEQYYCSGTTRGKTTFKNGRPDGYTVMYHENGKISEEGTWKINKWVGNYRLYYDNGQLQQEFSFNTTGKREGPQKYFYTNGQVMMEGSWSNGKEAGAVKEYYETGEVKTEKIYNNGEVDVASIKTFEPKKQITAKAERQATGSKKAVITKEENTQASSTNTKGSAVLNGYHVLYNKSKQKTKEGTFTNNRLIEGKNYIYNENGVLQKVEIYKEGVYQGDGLIED